MAHVAKYTQAQSGHLMNHYNRDKEAPCNRSNENIDPERTGQNYNLMQREQTPQEYMSQRLEEVYHLNRDDINVMCDWIITLPQDFNGDAREFFTHTTDFLNDRYGAENCIGAFVHMDETTPHLHYSFLPVTEDKNPKHEQDYKINAKEVIDRKELQHFHTDLENYLREKMPDKEIHMQRSIEERENNKLNRSIDEMKDHNAQMRIDKMKEETHRKEIDLQARQKDLDRQIQQAKGEQERYNQYWDRVEDYKAQNDMSDREYYMQCYKASQGLEQYPAPEWLNPEMQEKLKEYPSIDIEPLHDDHSRGVGHVALDQEREISPDR